MRSRDVSRCEEVVSDVLVMISFFFFAMLVTEHVEFVYIYQAALLGSVSFLYVHKNFNKNAWRLSNEAL